MEKPLEEDYTKKYYKDKLTVNASTLSKLKLASEGMNLLIGDLYKYIDHIEAELKKKDEKIKELQFQLNTNQKYGDEMFKEAEHLKSTLYSEKQLGLAIRMAAEESHIMGLPSTKDFKTYKEEQENTEREQ